MQLKYTNMQLTPLLKTNYSVLKMVAIIKQRQVTEAHETDQE